MPTIRTWIGGGDNRASDPNHWVDSNNQPGGPQPGDTLIMNTGTINISHRDLAGDTLTLIGSQNTINLDKADLKLQGSTEQQQGVNFTLNARGHNDSLEMISQSGTGLGILTFATINLADHTHLLMKGNLQFASGYFIDGGPGSEIINQGSITSGRRGSHTISTNIAGHGSITLNGATSESSNYDINGKVGVGQTFELVPALQQTTLIIEQPGTFHGLLDLSGSFASEVHTRVVLEGLTATSYSVKGDKLNLYNGHKIVDTLRLNNPTSQPFSVGATGSGVVLQFNGTAPGNILTMHGFHS